MNIYYNNTLVLATRPSNIPGKVKIRISKAWLTVNAEDLKSNKSK